MLNKLQKIDYDENLSEFDLSLTAPCDDRLMTKLTLNDYDWMNYVFETFLPTKTQGFLSVKVDYAGSTGSQMIVNQKINDKTITHIIDFNSDIFIEFLKDFLAKHIAQWYKTYAFCGEKEAVELFNKILDNHDNYKIE